MPSGGALQGNTQQLQGGNIGLTLQPAQGIPLYSRGAPIGSAPPPPTPKAGNTGNSTGGTGATNPLVAQGIMQEYGSAIAGGNALYGQNEANLPVKIGRAHV